MKSYFHNRKSFTLIELLVVLAIVAILSVVVIMTLNPAELLKQARDSTRLSDLSTLNTALAAYSADVANGFMGSSTKVYVSIPDTSPTCANLGLPALPTSTIVYTYSCVTATSTRLTNGQGWIPVNLSNISFGSPLSALPIDPINTTTSGQYYTYVSGASFILTAIPESTKQKTVLSTNPNIPNYPGVIAVGNNTSLSPLYNSSGLVGYWKFDEGSGTVAKDNSGQGNDGTWYGSAGHYVTGQMAYGGNFGGTTSDYVTVGSQASLSMTRYTVSAWVNIPSSLPSAGNYVLIYRRDASTWNYANYITGVYADNQGANAGKIFLTHIRPSTANDTLVGNFDFRGKGWQHWVAVYDGGRMYMYVNGILDSSVAAGDPSTAGTQILSFGREPLIGGMYFLGKMDDVRIYNRAYSAAEVSALFNATK